MKSKLLKFVIWLLKCGSGRRNYLWILDVIRQHKLRGHWRYNSPNIIDALLAKISFSCYVTGNWLPAVVLCCFVRYKSRTGMVISRETGRCVRARLETGNIWSEARLSTTILELKSSERLDAVHIQACFVAKIIR